DVGFDNCLSCFLPHTIHEDPGHPVLDHLNERQTLALCDWLDWAIRGEIEQIHAIKDVEPYGGLMSRVLRKMTGDPLRRLAWHREIVDNLRASVADD
ncbi:MAG TPA: hypothetical protein VNI20_08370, partial [Fimbriimonadaceae bacterium]|nr:hypothetical protein [Fimbriimonadaceae bacterium]